MVKKKNFRSIAISTSSSERNIPIIAKQLIEVLSNKEIEILLDKNLSLETNKKYKSYSEKTIIQRADLVIAIGGDGTMLNASRRYGSKGIPILGINLGKLGFLTDIAPEELTSSIIKVIENDYIEDKRFFLEAAVSNKKESFLALNEVVVHSGAIAQLIEYNLFVNDEFVYRQKADGIIISSPTGSTAYSLSGGGPIIHPNLDVLILMPMFPQTLSSSPLIVSAESSIKIELLDKTNKKHLSFDSHNSISLNGEAEVLVSKAKSELTLIHPKDHNFYESCRNKLGWSSSPIKE